MEFEYVNATERNKRTAQEIVAHTTFKVTEILSEGEHMIDHHILVHYLPSKDNTTHAIQNKARLEVCKLT